MSSKKMLYALTRVNMALAKPQPPSGAELQDLRDLVAEALAAGAQMLERVGRPRDPDSIDKPRGRRPSSRYQIDVSNAAPRIAVGGQAAADMVNAELTELGSAKRVTPNNLTVGIARNGGWWTKVETDGGTVVIEARRLPDAEKSA